MAHQADASQIAPQSLDDAVERLRTALRLALDGRTADDFAARTLTKAGRPARALGDILQRIAKGEGSTPLDFLRDHPLTDERRARLENESAQANGEALMPAGDWLALRAICNR